MYYQYNRDTLRFEPVSNIRRNISYLVIGLLLITASFIPISSNTFEKEFVAVNPDLNTFTEDKFKEKITELKIKFPDVVWSQSQVESDKYRSPIFMENHNMLGLKVSTTRPTTCIGENRGHAVFKDWEMCLVDYAIWQSTFTRGLTKEQYLDYLGYVYAEDPLYREKIVNKMKEYKP
jgi:hypothetical protein